MNIASLFKGFHILFKKKRKPDAYDYIDRLQADRIYIASKLGMNLNHRMCHIYTRLIRNKLYEMDEIERRFLADGGPEYPVERIR